MEMERSANDELARCVAFRKGTMPASYPCRRPRTRYEEAGGVSRAWFWLAHWHPVLAPDVRHGRIDLDRHQTSTG